MPTLTYKAFQQLDLPITEIVSGRIGFVHDLFLSFPYEVCDELPDDGRDLVVITGKGKRGGKIDELARYPGRVLFVTAPGDAPFREAYVPGGKGLPPNFVGAFATSNQLADRRVVGVPLGVRISNLRALQFVRQNRQVERQQLLYGNFTVNTEHYRPEKPDQPHIRAQIADRLKDQPWTTLDLSSERRDSPEQLISYYSQVAAHRFVLSPEGNGIDCYRTWEALYLGAIPIVMVSPSMSAFADLPILFTEDYSELSKEYLESCWSQMSARHFEIKRLLKSYYLHKFLDLVSRLESPRFLCWQFGSDKFYDLLERSSHSASGIVIETPTPPFTAQRDLSSPDDWSVSGGLCLEQGNRGIKLIAEAGRSSMAKFPFKTIAGGPFRLRGTVQADDAQSSPLTIKLEERSTVLAAVELNGDRGTKSVDLGFVARSDRTVLSIAVAPEGETLWSLSDLSVQADF